MSYTSCKSASSPTVSIRSCKGMISSSQAITTTARNSKTSGEMHGADSNIPAHCLNMFIENLVGETCRPDCGFSAIDLRFGADKHTEPVRLHAVLGTFVYPLADCLNFFAFVSQGVNDWWRKSLNTEIVSLRSSLLPSTSVTTGPSSRSACARI